MNKKVFGILVVFLMIPLVSAECASREDVLADRLDARYDAYYFRAEIKRISMDASIEYVEEIGKETGELESIRDDFNGLYDDAQDAVDAQDPKAFDEVIKEGRKTISEFRKSLRKMLDKEEIIGAKEAIRDAIEEESGYLDRLKDVAQQGRKEHILLVFDTRVCRTQERIDRMEGAGIEVEEFQVRLDRIDGIRDDLSDAVENAQHACDRIWLKKCEEDEAKKLHQLIKDIREEFKDLNKDMRKAWKDHNKPTVSANAQKIRPNTLSKGIKLRAQNMKVQKVAAVAAEVI